jgi:hypothetical protein
MDWIREQAASVIKQVQKTKSATAKKAKANSGDLKIEETLNL